MPSLIEATDEELENMALEGTPILQPIENELEYDRAALNVPSPPQIRRYIGEGAIENINSSREVEHMYNYIRHRSHFQQTDDSYRPRRLTYPENTSDDTTVMEAVV